jgi:hypothetical protein
MKEDFNNHIDRKILTHCNIKPGDIYTPIELCDKIKAYTDHIFEIYSGNNKEHTQTRKENVLKGLSYYLNKHPDSKIIK